MAELRAVIYVWGNLTADNFTPRPGNDTVGSPGQKPGLSASTMLPAGRKAQGVDLGKLRQPLQAFPDEVEQGGSPEHVAIAPVDDAGDVDLAQLEEWASFRGTGRTHAFTQMLLDAVTEPNVKGIAP